MPTPHEIIADTLPGLGTKTATRDGCVYVVDAPAPYRVTVRMSVHDGQLVATSRVTHPSADPKSRQRIFPTRGLPHAADIIKQDIGILTRQIADDLGESRPSP